MGGCIALDEPSTQAEFGALVGVSQQTVSELATAGVWKSQVPVAENLRTYVARLREEAAGRDTELARERARLAREQADGMAIKNAVARKEYAPIALLEEVLAQICRQIVGVCEALPIEMKRRAPHLSTEDLALVEGVVVRIRNAAANTKIDADAFDVEETLTPDGPVAGEGDREAA